MMKTPTMAALPSTCTCQAHQNLAKLVAKLVKISYVYKPG